MVYVRIVNNLKFIIIIFMFFLIMNMYLYSVSLKFNNRKIHQIRKGTILIKTEDIVKIASYFTIIAHSSGRLRVRVNPKIKQESGNISLSDIENLPKKIDGIEEIKINKIVASVTIRYKADIFAPKLWEDLINGQNLDEVTSLINKLAKEVI